MTNTGDIKKFDKKWKERKDKKRTWFFRGEPKNQIEYAFGQHWSFLREVVGIPKTGKCIEVGCGRGSLSSFFADNGYEVTLADLSDQVIQDAREIFKELSLDKNVEFIVTDANALDIADETYDMTTSVGLLEHFENPKKVIEEQVRILKKGGVFTAYVVPEKQSVHRLFNPFNDMLKRMFSELIEKEQKQEKEPLFRTDFGGNYYKDLMLEIGLKDIKSSGVFPYPSISYSPQFPFSVMPEYFEKALVEVFKNLEKLKREKGEHPWACDEALGQGFFVWGIKQ